jgi:selenide,water dikinase
MCGLAAPTDPNVLVGFTTGDDCGVYRLSPELAIVQSVDVLTPIVDDPWLFGQIAAANALSDLYAMGAQPRTALNILAIPPEGFDLDEAREILRGGCEKLAEAGAALLGGHTIEDPELKYGVAVTGTVHPDRLLTNAAAHPGDGLVLTKPLGTGIISTALKAGLAAPDHAAAAAASMARLNARAAEAALACGAHACTDVTGFGLVGHLLQMLEASGVGAVVEAARVPLLAGALEYCGMGLRTMAGAEARRFYACKVDIADGVDEVLVDVLHDAQTSGGLLVALGEPERLVERLRGAGLAEAAVIGRVLAEPRGRLSIL